MEAELKALEDKLGQLAQLCQRLRAENSQLRQELAASVNDRKRLSEKIDAATGRLENLIEQIPVNQ